MFHVKQDSEPGPAASAVFGERLPLALRYAELLRDTAISHGLIGPREAARLWERHLLNCAVLSELVEPNVRVLDLGSGAGLPGIPLALARPDLEIVLLEPMARRVTWLRQTVAELGLETIVVRGRAEDPEVRREWRGAHVVTARAVAPLHRLAGWALPLLRPGGRMLAIKGQSATAEVDRDAALVRRLGGTAPRVVQCGAEHVDPPTVVVVVERAASEPRRRSQRARGPTADTVAIETGSVRHRRTESGDTRGRRG
ncbi:MAG: 16S rRNA (guanine(527)-N(7))-methyltransferase RsmG [Pseudonocardiales bacterium]|nr:16S rRNA (guanine(527)-N(7))-methyltransferase RsmG [Pseudonocardiales bacterium]